MSQAGRGGGEGVARETGADSAQGTAAGSSTSTARDTGPGKGTGKLKRASALFVEALGSQVVVADGAMGTQIQLAQPTLADYQGHEGCNEILNVTRPDIIAGIHQAYLAAGAQAITTNTFGANWSNLADYFTEHRDTEHRDIGQLIYDYSYAGARIARSCVDQALVGGQAAWVLGSMGPGSKLPSLGHTTYAHLKDSSTIQAQGLIDGGVDVLLIETVQDLLQAKAAVAGARDAMAHTGVRLAVLVSVTMEQSGTMLLGSEIGAALVALQSLGIDGIGLNCATGPDLMGEHLRFLASHSPLPLFAQPNAGLPVLGKHGAHYPLTPDQLTCALGQFVSDFGLSMVGGCCGSTPDHISQLVQALAGKPVTSRQPQRLNALSSLYAPVELTQDSSYLAVGERSNANGSLAFRQAMLAGNLDAIVDIARDQASQGAHLLDVCVDYVGRDGVADMSLIAGRLATASSLPLMIDSTEPAVIQAGLQALGGRAVVNSVSCEDGDGPGSRFSQIMPLVAEHGAAVVALTIDEQGQARTAADKVRIACRLVDKLTSQWGMRVDDIVVDCLTFPITTGQEENRRDAIETLEAIAQLQDLYPGIHTCLGVSNVSFGLSPAARTVLNSVFLALARHAGLDTAIVNPAKIVPRTAVDLAQWQACEDLIWDRRVLDSAGQLAYDPLARVLELFNGVDAAALRDSRQAQLAALPVTQRLTRRIVDGNRQGLDQDINVALAQGLSPVTIINDHLLAGMQEVGRLFNSGHMQLPFVLLSAEVMKASVALLEPHLRPDRDRDGDHNRDQASGGREAGPHGGLGLGDRGTIVLATVRGDVHDIGKNLVDIILSTNGYRVINIGIKQSITAIIEAAQEHQADVIGMSGLLVKSTQVMKENLEELTARGLAKRWPVMLGGAALTRSYVDNDLQSLFPGVVRYAKDAFEGLRLMEPLVAIARGAQPNGVGPDGVGLDEVRPDGARLDGIGLDEVRPDGPELDGIVRPAVAQRRRPVLAVDRTPAEGLPDRSDVAHDNLVPQPPFWGSRLVTGLALDDIVSCLDQKALFTRQWGLRASQGLPRLARWLEKVRADRCLEPAVAYGYFPVWSQGQDIVIAHHQGPDGGSGGELGTQRMRLTFPRQHRDRHLCLADFIKPRAWVEKTGHYDVLPIQLVTMGQAPTAYANRLFERGHYRDYMEIHGLSVALTEALAEAWHRRIRADLGFASQEPASLDGLLAARYQGARFSLGYPACPDMSDRRAIMELLGAHRLGVQLSDELQLHPEQSTDALVFHHPQAKYFSV